MDGGTRQTQKLDPKQLLGLVALTAGRERLRPTCEMPKLELATLLNDPAIGRTTPMPVGVITEATCMMQNPAESTSAPEEPQLAKGSSGIVAMPKALLELAHEIDMSPQDKPAPDPNQQKRPTTQIESLEGSFTAATDASPRRSQPFASIASAATRRASDRIVFLWAMGGAAIGLGLAWMAL